MRLSAKSALAANADITREDEQPLDSKAGPVKTDVYQTIIASDLPPQEKEAGRIAQEVFTLIFAGSSSTARVLTRTTFHLASDPAIQNRLRQELKTIMADPSASPEMEQLEALPYLVSNSTIPFRLPTLKNEVVLLLSRNGDGGQVPHIEHDC
jgi:cytochrome P450